MKEMQKIGVVLGVSLASAGSAFAFDCSTLADPYYAQWYGSDHPECNAAASTQIITGAPIQQMQAISNAITLQNFGLGGGPMQAAQGQGIRGLSAGANNPKWNAWASGNSNDTDFSKAGSNAFNFSGNQYAVTVGTDYRLSPMATIGVSAANDNGYIKPQNGGGLKLTNSGINIAPYFAYQFNKNYSVDATVGMGWGNLKRSGGGVTSYNADTERRFAGVNLNSGYWYGNVQVAGKASLFYSHQRNDTANGGGFNGLDEATKYLAQGRLGVQTSYWVGNGFMPYIGLTYVNDIARNRSFGVSLDRDGFVAGIGLNYFSKTGITGGISYTSEFGRNDVTNNVFMANVNVRF